MKTWTKFNVDTGEIIGWSSGDAECPGDDYVLSPDTGPGDHRTQYVHGGKVCNYSPKEQLAKDSMPYGHTWLMPDRRVVDLRSTEQQIKDSVTVVINSRIANYPPLQDLADALYWQSKGDTVKLQAYLAACDKVKEAFPKPTVS